MRNLLLLSIIALCSCEGSTYDREKKGLIKEYDLDYSINSIRVDDDAEYHIVAVSPKGNVETISDAKNGYDIRLAFSNTTAPILRLHFTDRNYGEGKFYPDQNPVVLLPYGYKVETFED